MAGQGIVSGGTKMQQYGDANLGNQQSQMYQDPNTRGGKQTGFNKQ